MKNAVVAMDLTAEEEALILKHREAEKEMTYDPELLDMLQPGKKVMVFYGIAPRLSEIRHIRAIVDKEYIAYRVWSYKQRWLYYIVWIYDFQLTYEGDRLKAIG